MNCKQQMTAPATGRSPRGTGSKGTYVTCLQYTHIYTYTRRGASPTRPNPKIKKIPPQITISHSFLFREWSRVFYSIDLRIPSWIPGFVVNILNTQALTSVSLR